jgi:hypothetical protein
MIHCRSDATRFTKSTRVFGSFCELSFNMVIRSLRILNNSRSTVLLNTFFKNSLSSYFSRNFVQDQLISYHWKFATINFHVDVMPKTELASSNVFCCFAFSTKESEISIKLKDWQKSHPLYIGIWYVRAPNIPSQIYVYICPFSFLTHLLAP